MQEANQSQLPYHKDSDSRSNHIFDQDTQPVIYQSIGKLQSWIFRTICRYAFFQFNRKGARMQNAPMKKTEPLGAAGECGLWCLYWNCGWNFNDQILNNHFADVQKERCCGNRGSNYSKSRALSQTNRRCTAISPLRLIPETLWFNIVTHSSGDRHYEHHSHQDASTATSAPLMTSTTLARSTISTSST